MDKDKLNEAMLRAWCQYRNMEYVPDFVNPLPSENFERGFKQGTQWLMQQPLADRLTDEEKEKIRAIYKDYEKLETYGEALSDRTAGRMQCFTLEQIFGKELFNEK